MATSTLKAYLEIRVEVPRDAADAVCDFIINNITNGMILEEEEESDTIGIIFYIPDGKHWNQQEFENYLSSLFDLSVPVVPRISHKRVEETEWIDSYRAGIQPVSIGEDIVIRPVWIPAIGAKYEIVLEPKMAFGTGSHATTRGSLLAIRRWFKPGMRFLDVGAGSGILSILAVKMGASFIKAVDNDETSIANCRENFELNDVTTSCEIVRGSIEHCTSDQPYDFVVANIICSTILEILNDLVRLTISGGVLVLSGLLTQDEEVISMALQDVGLLDFSVHRDEGWLTYTVNKG